MQPVILLQVHLFGIHRLHQSVYSIVSAVPDHLHIGQVCAQLSFKIIVICPVGIPDVNAQLIPDLRPVIVHGIQDPVVILAHAQKFLLVGRLPAGSRLLHQLQPIALLRVGAARVAPDVHPRIRFHHALCTVRGQHPNVIAAFPVFLRRCLCRRDLDHRKTGDHQRILPVRVARHRQKRDLRPVGHQFFLALGFHIRKEGDLTPLRARCDRPLLPVRIIHGQRQVKNPLFGIKRKFFPIIAKNFQNVFIRNYKIFVNFMNRFIRKAGKHLRRRVLRQEKNGHQQKKHQIHTKKELFFHIDS